MKIYIGQIYIRAGVSFPFSLRFQKWLGDKLTSRVDSSDEFRNSFPGDFTLGFIISAKSENQRPEIVGPTVFKRAKDVEFTIFLPHENRDYHTPEACQETVRLLIESIVAVLDRLQIDSTKICNDVAALLADFLVTPELMKSPPTTTH